MVVVYTTMIIGVYIQGTLHFNSVAQSCPTLCDPMNHSTPGLPVCHQLPEFSQTHAHWVSDAIQSSHPLSSPSPPAPYPSQHQGLFQWVNSSHEVAKILEFQLQILHYITSYGKNSNKLLGQSNTSFWQIHNSYKYIYINISKYKININIYVYVCMCVCVCISPVFWIFSYFWFFCISFVSPMICLPLQILSTRLATGKVGAGDG